MKYIDVAKDVAEITGVPEDTIILIYKKYFKFLINKVRGLNTKEIRCFDDYKKCKASFNLQHLGKFYINYKIIKQRNENTGNTTDVQQYSDNG